ATVPAGKVSFGSLSTPQTSTFEPCESAAEHHQPAQSTALVRYTIPRSTGMTLCDFDQTTPLSLERRTKIIYENSAVPAFITDFTICWQGYLFVAPTLRLSPISKPQTLRQAMAKTQVILYTRPGCHLCEEAKQAIE